MEENSVRPFLNFRVIGLVIRASGLGPWTVIFAVLFLASSVIVSMFEPEVGGIGNSMWLMFQVVTTIGLGDFTAVSFVGRIAAIVLSVYSVFYRVDYGCNRELLHREHARPTRREHRSFPLSARASARAEHRGTYRPVREGEKVQESRMMRRPS